VRRKILVPYPEAFLKQIALIFNRENYVTGVNGANERG